MPEEKSPEEKKNIEKNKKIPSQVQETSSQTKHTITLNGEKIEYTVTTGTIILKEEDVEEGEKQKASIFFIAYTKDTALNSRPVTFTFNGGPGSSSVWLHLGLVGPKRVLMDDEGKPIGPPYQLIDNDFYDKFINTFPSSLSYSFKNFVEFFRNFNGNHTSQLPYLNQ